MMMMMECTGEIIIHGLLNILCISIFRLKYERTINELDEAKRRLVNQHEDDLEQMMTIKKQMEKKLNEAYEEVDEQKRDSAGWKNKYKKVQVNVQEIPF